MDLTCQQTLVSHTLVGVDTTTQTMEEMPSQDGLCMNGLLNEGKDLFTVQSFVTFDSQVVNMKST